MTDKLLRKFNRIFHDRLGAVPYGKWAGQSLFRWMESKDLMCLVRVGTESKESTTPGGLIVIENEPKCEWQRQRDEDGWVLAGWYDSPPKQEWQGVYGTLHGFPEKDGYWFSIVPLVPGEVPTEHLTYRMAEQMGWQKKLSYTEHLRLIQEYRKHLMKKSEQRISDIFDDALVSHVPGVRGGGYSVPATKFDR